MSWTRILVIANNVFRQIIRDHVLYLIAFFTVFLLGAKQVLVYLAATAADKIFLDLGLAAIAALGLILTVFVGTSLVTQEIEKRTVILLLSKPISPTEFILGKHFGLTAVIAVLIAALTLIYLITLSLYELPYSLGAIVVANGFLVLEFALLIAIALLFSIWASALFAALFTLAIYLMGHLSQDLVKWIEIAKNPDLQKFAQNLYLVLPDLSRLNFRNEAVYNALPNGMTLVVDASYGVLYTIAILILAILLFMRREF